MHEATLFDDTVIPKAAVLDENLLHNIFCNEQPTAIQAVLIPGLVQERTEQVRDLRIRIDRLRALLQENEATERKATVELHALRYASASPVRRLPSELLAEVFACCQIDDDSKESAMIVSHVCSRWRAVAFGSARLWTCLTVTRTYAQNRDHWEQIVAWFARASPLLLDVRILSKDKRTQKSPIPQYPLFAASGTAELSAQVGKLTLHALCQLDVMESLFHPGASFSQLAYFEADNPNSRIVTDALPSTAHCPNLRTVVLQNLYDLTDEKLSVGFPLPWFQLEVLSMGNFTDYDEVGTVFLGCTGLRKADLSGIGMGHISEGLKNSMTVFSMLEDLNLELMEFPSAIFDLTHYPALTKLRLSATGADWYCEDYHSELLALADHMPALTDLTLGAFCMTRKYPGQTERGDYNMTSVFARLSSLRTLRFEDCYMHHWFFAGLRLDAELAILPHLETLDLSDTKIAGAACEDTTRLATEELYRAVKSRAGPPGCGESLRLLRVGLPFGVIKIEVGPVYDYLVKRLHCLRPEVHVEIEYWTSLL